MLFITTLHTIILLFVKVFVIVLFIKYNIINFYIRLSYNNECVIWGYFYARNNPQLRDAVGLWAAMVSSLSMYATKITLIGRLCYKSADSSLFAIFFIHLFCIKKMAVMHRYVYIWKGHIHLWACWNSSLLARWEVCKVKDLQTANSCVNSTRNLRHKN